MKNNRNGDGKLGKSNIEYISRKYFSIHDNDFCGRLEFEITMNFLVANGVIIVMANIYCRRALIIC